MKRLLAPIIMMSIMCNLLVAFGEKEAKERVREIKAWLPTFEYSSDYKIESEEALKTAILFVEEPLKYISSVRGLDQPALWRDVRLYETFMYETKKTNSGLYFYGQIRSLTTTMSEEKVPLLTFVLLNCRSAMEGESIADLYCRLFSSNTRMFIQYLSKGEDWKQVVNRMAICDAYETKGLLMKLGDSPFEKEFREYVLTKYPFIRELMKKK